MWGRVASRNGPAAAAGTRSDCRNGDSPVISPGWRSPFGAIDIPVLALAARTEGDRTPRTLVVSPATDQRSAAKWAHPPRIRVGDEGRGFGGGDRYLHTGGPSFRNST